MGQKKEKYSLKDSKEAIGPLYPRLLDKQGREIDGFHREEADSAWPTTKLEHIDTDVKYWVARIAANTHRRRVEPDERRKELTELAKALRAEGREGSLVGDICRLTTFSKQYVGNLLPDEYKIRPGMGDPTGGKPSLPSEQPFKQKPREQTTDEEKLKNLYEKVEKSVFTGQGSLTKYISDAKSLGLNVENYEKEAEEFKNCLQDSLGRRYEDVKDGLNNAYKRSTEIKKALSQQIKDEEERREKLKESLKGEATEASMKEAIEMSEKERIEKLLEEIPKEFTELKNWVREGFWSIEQIKTLIDNPRTKKQITDVLEKSDEKLKNNVKTRKTSMSYASQLLNLQKKHFSPPPLPQGQFDVILADPPWKYDFKALQGNIDEQYPDMETKDICTLEIKNIKIQDKINKDAILFLWATNPKIEDALLVLKAWNFVYKTNLAWIKGRGGIGHYLQGDHELLLIGIKGKMPPPMPENRPSSVLESKKTGHSKKPKEVYEIIEKMYPTGKYLELFAREKRQKWISWGLDIKC